MTDNNQQVYSTHETMAWNIVNKTTSELSVSEMVLKVIDQNHHGIDTATIFGIVIQQVLKPDHIPLDSALMAGLMEEELIKKTNDGWWWVLTDRFKALLSKEESVKGKAPLTDLYNNLSIKEIAKNIVYQPEETLTELDLVAKLIYDHSPINKAIVDTRYWSRRKSIKDSISVLIARLQEFGIVNKSDPVLFVTSEFNALVTQHKKEFHENIQGPVGKAAAAIRESNQEEQMKQTHHPLICLPIMTMAEQAISTGREKNIHFEGLDRNAVLSSIMARCNNFLNPLSQVQGPIYPVDYVFYALWFSRFSSLELSELTFKGLERFGYPLRAAKDHVTDMFYDAMLVLQEHNIIDPLENTSALKHNHASEARLTDEAFRLSDEWKGNGTMPGNSADDEMKSGENVKQIRIGLEKGQMREYLTPLVSASRKGTDFIDDSWTAQERITFLVFITLSEVRLRRLTIFARVTHFLKDNLPPHETLVDWIATSLKELTKRGVADSTYGNDEPEPFYWLTSDAVTCIEEIETRVVGQQPVPFESSYSVYGTPFTNSELYTLVKLLVKFVFMHEEAEFEGGMKVSGITFDKEKATALLDELLKDKMASFLVQACGYPNPQPKSDHRLDTMRRYNRLVPRLTPEQEKDLMEAIDKDSRLGTGTHHLKALVDSWSMVNTGALERYIRDYPYGPKTESDIPNGH